MQIKTSSHRTEDIDEIIALENGLDFPESSNLYITAYVDGIPAGYLAATSYEVVTCIHAVFVLSEFRRRGLAAALLTEIKASLTKGKSLQLDCFVHNKEAYSLYEKMGFKPYFITMQCTL